MQINSFVPGQVGPKYRYVVQTGNGEYTIADCRRAGVGLATITGPAGGVHPCLIEGAVAVGRHVTVYRAGKKMVTSVTSIEKVLAAA